MLDSEGIVHPDAPDVEIVFSNHRVAQKSKPPPIFQKNRIKDCQRD